MREVSVLDMDKFRLGQDSLAEIKPETKSARRKTKNFIKGPIPLDWLTIAGTLPGKTLHVAIALWLAYGIEKQARFKFTPKWHGHFNLSPATVRRALHRLRESGLIRLEYNPGCAPIVIMLDSPEK